MFDIKTPLNTIFSFLILDSIRLKSADILIILTRPKNVSRYKPFIKQGLCFGDEFLVAASAAAADFRLAICSYLETNSDRRLPANPKNRTAVGVVACFDHRFGRGDCERVELWLRRRCPY